MCRPRWWLWGIFPGAIDISQKGHLKSGIWTLLQGIIIWNRCKYSGLVRSYLKSKEIDRFWEISHTYRTDEDSNGEAKGWRHGPRFDLIIFIKPILSRRGIQCAWKDSQYRRRVKFVKCWRGCEILVGPGSATTPRVLPHQKTRMKDQPMIFEATFSII